jgi:hypothetical protein
MARSRSGLTVAGAALLLATALIDLLLYFGLSIPFGYPGVLFLLNAAAGIGLAAMLVAGVRVAWDLGAAFTAATIVLFVLSRTTGLPGLQLSDWLVFLGFLPLGPLSLVVEGLFVVVYALAVLPARRQGTAPTAPPGLAR